MYYNNCRYYVQAKQDQAIAGLGVLVGLGLKVYGMQTGYKAPGVLYDAATIAMSNNVASKIVSTMSLASTVLGY